MGVSFTLLAISGIMSGLTIGLASIDHLTLEIAAKQSKEMEKSAKNIFAVINQHHWMLVTLLFCNACCLEALPIYLSKAVSELWAIIFSVFGVLVAGEIIPQAICTGPKQIQIAELLCPLVLGCMYLTFPITWPIAKLLDILLGEHKIQRFRNKQLSELIHLHSKEQLDQLVHGRPSDVVGLDPNQTAVMTGAIDINAVLVEEILTPIHRVEKLYLGTVLDKSKMRLIHDKGYSRVPIALSEENPIIVGVLLVKSLISVELDGQTVAELFLQNKIQLKIPIYLSKDTRLPKVGRIFKQGYSHMAVVCDSEDNVSVI